MSVSSTTLTNYRESLAPYQGEDNDGGKALNRQYQATIQGLVEGDVRAVIQGAQDWGLGEVYQNLSSIPDIPINETDSFVASTDLNPPDANQLIIYISEVSSQYSKSQYGNLQTVFSVDVIGAKQYWDSTEEAWTDFNPIQF